jgi:hypothetical protein
LQIIKSAESGNPERRFGEVGSHAGQAAQMRRQCRFAALEIVDGVGRCQGLQLDRGDDRLLADDLVGEGVHRDRHALDVFLAPPCRDDDFLKAHGRRRLGHSLLCLGGVRRGRAHTDQRGTQQGPLHVLCHWSAFSHREAAAWLRQALPCSGIGCR